MLHRHPGEGRDLAGAFGGEDEIPAFAGMTDEEGRRFAQRRFCCSVGVFE
jgi:hypothetical protein